jgi:hypothetical protein
MDRVRMNSSRLTIRSENREKPRRRRSRLAIVDA